jgi:ABC-type transport system involved in multi-copper enzyme maturation permease subunit
MVVWWFVLIASWLFFLKGTHGPETARLRVVGVASAPLGFFLITSISHADVGCAMLGSFACIAVHALLATWYIMRFGRTDDHGIRSPRGAIRDRRRSEALARPRRFALTAIAWKQARESGPVVIAGLVAIVAIVSCYCLTAWYLVGNWVNETGFIYSQTATFFGFVIALVAGIGVALHDVGSRLNNFWRSRPIHPDLWFWAKFVTGLVIVLAAVYAPIGLFAAAGDTSLNEGMKYPDALTIAAAQVAVFAAAVMVTCLVRQAVYAAILSIAVVYLGILVTQAALVAARYTGLIYWDRSYWFQPTPDEIMAGLLATFIVCAVVAWLAMRNDWGRASR